MNERSIRDFHGEVAMLKTLCHPNIVQFIGACCDPICLITEYCHKGNLFDVLQNAPSSLEWSLVLKLATDAARGMAFLHAHKPVIIHRDLKSLNLLVSDRWTLKVSDFGLSRFKAASVMTGQCGTYQWMAPEVIASQHYNEKAVRGGGEWVCRGGSGGGALAVALTLSRALDSSTPILLFCRSTSLPLTLSFFPSFPTSPALLSLLYLPILLFLHHALLSPGRVFIWHQSMGDVHPPSAVPWHAANASRDRRHDASPEAGHPHRMP